MWSKYKNALSGVGVCQLRRSSMIETQHPTESLNAPDRSKLRFLAAIRLDQPVVEPLVVIIPNSFPLTRLPNARVAAS